jgi:hypothetical protein
MKTIHRTAGLLSVALLAGGLPSVAHGGLRAPEEPSFGIHAAKVSACGQVLVKYWAPATAPIEISRSVADGPWERQPPEPNPRFDPVSHPVRYKIVFGDREAVTDSLVPYRCHAS